MNVEDKIEIYISFIVPVYNTKQVFLQKCIGSIGKIKSSKEIILIDDGSTSDETIHLLRTYEKTKEIKIIYKNNAGPAAARNVGLNMACGKYIVFVDSDDSINSVLLEELLQLMEKEKGEILCHTYDVINEEGTFKSRGNNSGEFFRFSSFDEIRNSRDSLGKMPAFNAGLIWGKIYKRAVIGDTRFDESLHFCEDNLFNMSQTFKKRNIIGVYRSAYVHLDNSESLCNKYNPMACACFMKSALKMQEALENCKDQKVWNDFYKTVIFHFYLNNILKLDIFNKKNEKSSIEKENMANEVLAKEPFASALQNIKINTLSARQKIVLALLKMRMCKIAYRLFWIRR